MIRALGWAVVLAVALLAMVGCAVTANPTTTVEVPIGIPCDPPEVIAPTLPIDALDPEADTFEHVRALWASIERMEGYEIELRAAIDACRKGPTR